MTTLSIAVCAHISRKEKADDLALQLDCPIALDEGDRGSVANHDAAFRLAAEVQADWYVVIEDDALPIPDFRAQAAAALATAPVPFAALYYGYCGTADEFIRSELEKRDPDWFLRQGFSNGVCLAVQHEFFAPMMRHVETIDNIPADHRYAEAASKLGYRWLPHANPSLVEHGDDGSLIAGDTTNFPRRAYRVGGREKWTGKTL